MAQTMQAHRPRSLDASSVDGLFVGVVVGRVDRLGTRRARSKSKNGASRTAEIEVRSVPRSSWDTQWRPRASRRCPWSVAGASPGVPGTPPERPKSDLRRSRTPKIGAHRRPGTRRGDQNRRDVAPLSDNGKFFTRSSVAKHGRSKFASIFVDVWLCRTIRKPCFVPRLPAKTEVRLIVLHVDSLARCNLEKRRKWTRKSSKITSNSMQSRSKWVV